MFTLAACSIGSSVWRMSSPSPLAGEQEGGGVGGGGARGRERRPAEPRKRIKTHWCAEFELYQGAWMMTSSQGVLVRSTFARSACSQLYCAEPLE